MSQPLLNGVWVYLSFMYRKTKNYVPNTHIKLLFYKHVSRKLGIETRKCDASKQALSREKNMTHYDGVSKLIYEPRKNRVC